MSINTPPTVFFNGINFNPAFYSIGDEAVTFKFIDANYLRSTNYAISRAAYTQFYGTIYVFNGISGSGSMLTDLNASNITSGTLTVSRGGIGTSSLNNNQLLIGNGINSLLQSSNLTWDNTSNTLSASNFVGSGSAITNLNASNITFGTLPITRGGIGTTTLSNNQLLIGNGTTSVLQTPNLSWDNTNSILYASNFVGSGSGITNINASNITSGILPISRGGIGTTTLTSGKLLIGNGTSALLQSSNLTWDNVNNRLGIVATVPGYTLDVLGNINCQELYRNGTTLASTLSNFLPTSGGTLTGVLSGTTISATNFSGSGSGITNINASNITSGTIGIGTAASPTIAINCYNSSSTFFQNIQMMNNASEFFYFGIAGNAAANGSYLNNFFIQASKSLVFNSTNKTHLAVPDMMIKDSTVGINTSTPNTTYKLDVSGNINGLILYESGVSLASKYLTSASIATTYLKLDGTNNMAENLTANKKIYFANTLAAAPAFGVTGGNGDRIILYAGNTNAYPYSIGIDNFVQYYSVPAGSAHRFLAAGTNLLQIQGSVSTFSNKLQVLTAGTGAPTLAATGGTGDFIILKQGSATVHPYSLGLNTTEMWYSVPSGNTHKFYINGTSRYEINSTGATVTGALSMNGNINMSGNNSIIFDNAFNDKKLQMSTTSGMGLDTNGLVFYSSGVFTFKNTALTTLYSVDSGGNMSTNGIMYPAGGVSSAGNITSFATLAGVTITEGGTTLNSKYVRLNGANSMTGNLNIINNSKLIFNNNIDDMRIQLWDGYGFGINGGTLRYNSASDHRFYAGSTTTAIINGSGNVGIGTTQPRGKLDVYSGALIVRGTNEGASAALYLGTPFDDNSAFKCALICQGLSSWSRSKLHICLNNTANNSILYNAEIADYCATFDYNGNVGIGNPNPLDNGGSITHLCIGSSGIEGSDGSLVIAKRGNGNRQCRLGYDPSFFFCIGDYGSENTIGTWKKQIAISWIAPGNSILIDSAGVVYGIFQNTSDERIKTDINTIEDALYKVSQLRGVEYTRIEENTREIGLIAQEVEYIIPEAVKENEKTKLKGINYGGLVGLLVQAIKEQQEQINELRNILIKNNLS